MNLPFTLHTLASCKTWPSYQAAYLKWMKRVNHPDLRVSNYNASTWKERNLNVFSNNHMSRR